jgi:hypothetical protein
MIYRYRASPILAAAFPASFSGVVFRQGAFWIYLSGKLNATGTIGRY